MLKSSTMRLICLDAGLQTYEDGLALQAELHARTLRGQGEIGFLVRIEHPAVITLGKNASDENLLVSPAEIAAAGIDLARTDRGGEVTAHMPGQLVIYPILPLVQLALSARSYIFYLEETVISLLSAYGVVAERSPDYPGVWVGNAKVCAIGVRIKHRVSLHGLALNVNNQLDLFSKIIPCGIQGRGVTSLATFLGAKVDVGGVWEKYKTIFAAKLALPFMDMALKDLLET